MAQIERPHPNGRPLSPDQGKPEPEVRKRLVNQLLIPNIQRIIKQSGEPKATRDRITVDIPNEPPFAARIAFATATRDFSFSVYTAGEKGPGVKLRVTDKSRGGIRFYNLAVKQIDRLVEATDPLSHQEASKLAISADINRPPRQIRPEGFDVWEKKKKKFR